MNLSKSPWLAFILPLAFILLFAMWSHHAESREPTFIEVLMANAKAQQAAEKKAAEEKAAKEKAAKEVLKRQVLGRDIPPPLQTFEIPKVFKTRAFALIVVKRLEDKKPKIYAVNIHDELFNIIEFPFGTETAVNLFELVVAYPTKPVK